MNVLIVGNEHQHAECALRFGDSHTYTQVPDHRQALQFLGDANVVLDFELALEPELMEIYQGYNGLVLTDSTQISLHQLAAMVSIQVNFSLAGFCGWNTFISRLTWEVAVLNDQTREKLESIGETLGLKYTLVDDRVGLVMPRILSMIINEAYFTVQEGTATREDVDLAMKLGTNYPYGPFEWAQRIGLAEIYETLLAVFEDTGDPRYRISPLLKQEYLSLLAAANA